LSPNTASITARRCFKMRSCIALSSIVGMGVTPHVRWAREVARPTCAV
jgi:hypothetical protein